MLLISSIYNYQIFQYKILCQISIKPKYNYKKIPSSACPQPKTPNPKIIPHPPSLLNPSKPNPPNSNPPTNLHTIPQSIQKIHNPIQSNPNHSTSSILPSPSHANQSKSLNLPIPMSN